MHSAVESESVQSSQKLSQSAKRVSSVRCSGRPEAVMLTFIGLRGVGSARTKHLRSRVQLNNNEAQFCRGHCCAAEEIRTCKCACRRPQAADCDSARFRSGHNSVFFAFLLVLCALLSWLNLIRSASFCLPVSLVDQLKAPLCLGENWL